LGLDIQVGPCVLTVRHGVTHHRITLACYEARRAVGRVHAAEYAGHRWVLRRDLGRYAYSSPQRQLIQAIKDPRRMTPELF
jgi:hypothetical protein